MFYRYPHCIASFVKDTFYFSPPFPPPRPPPPQEAMEGIRACQQAYANIPQDQEEIKKRAMADPEVQVSGAPIYF